MSSRTPTGRGVRLPRAQREAQILQVAESVFAERGYQATTMEDVAERVGVTKPMIYEYFGSKEGLLAACIAEARSQLRDATNAAWQTVPESASMEELFRAGIRAFFDFIDDHASAFALIQHEAAIQAHAGAGIESIRQQQTDYLVAALQAQLALPAAPAALLEGYAEVVVGSCERVAVWRSRRQDVSAADATELVMGAVWHGLSSLVAPTFPSPTD
jgi:AcrR family transcriptional regulator